LVFGVRPDASRDVVVGGGKAVRDSVKASNRLIERHRVKT
jgi:hypothetical protein